MNDIPRKITKIADELIYYLLRVGAENLKLTINKENDRFIITIDSNYGENQIPAIKGLERMLLEANRDKSIEEEYWELMGMNGSRYDPQLQLVGMLVDKATITLGIRTVHIELVRIL